MQILVNKVSFRGLLFFEYRFKSLKFRLTLLTNFRNQVLIKYDQPQRAGHNLGTFPNILDIPINIKVRHINLLISIIVQAFSVVIRAAVPQGNFGPDKKK